MTMQQLKIRGWRRRWAGCLMLFWLACWPAAQAQGSQPAKVEAFGDNPGELEYYYMPPAGGKSRDLLVLLHGCGQQATTFARQSGWLRLANELGAGLVLPQQIAANNQKLCFNWYREQDVRRLGSELASINAMIADASQRQGAGRIYIAGLSAGGAMAAAMLATYPERFEAGAVVAGVAYRCGMGLLNAFGCMQQGSALDAKALAALVAPGSQRLGRDWPRLSIWHGEADAVVNVANAHALKRQWLGLMQLAVTADNQQQQGPWRRQQWRRGDQVALELNLVAGMNHGHAIDGRQGGEAAPFVLEQGIATAREIARFFGLLPAGS